MRTLQPLNRASFLQSRAKDSKFF
uniref:Uncharacterized protein n=1 Tax=Arundo donax TaxID=35708 RepID=A0A0A9GIF9_ARUDO